MLKALLGFELKKLAKAPKTIVTCILILLVSFGYFAYNFYLDSRYDAVEARITRYDEERKSVTRIAGGLTQEAFLMRFAISNEDDPERIDSYEQELAVSNDSIKALEKIASSSLQEKYYASLKDKASRVQELKATLDKLLAVQAAMAQEIYIGGRLVRQYPDLQALDNAIKEVEYLQEHNIFPLDSPYDTTALPLICKILTNVLPLLLILLLVICADSFAAEADSGSYKTLLLQPVSRSDIYLAKLSAAFLFCTAVFITVLLLVFGIAVITSGLGAPLYPIAVPDRPAMDAVTSTSVVPMLYIPLIRHIAIAVAMVVLFLLFLTAFAACVSANSSTAMVALASTVSLFCAGYSTPLLGSVARFIPFTFATASAVFQFGAGTALMVLVAGVVILLTIGQRSFAKADIL